MPRHTNHEHESVELSVELATIKADIKYMKWGLAAVIGGTFGQYLGLAGTVSQALPFHK